ncbi:MAF protein [Saccharomonospora marina XMU15]|uniref:Nucleoside triphosphate pyrophosphatase n=1 Tax=Saccharomonospora marina XMU15 TaxID=882083 RepID=H5X969_9PSEU|nr:Maf family protein [Saccharomonospora marina]EHR49171.1 MAF protein [Saccharomonospora marina XMU15]
MRFVLASASPARLAVLRAAGIEPSVIVSGVDEETVASRLPDPSPSELVTALAMAKAEAVARSCDIATITHGPQAPEDEGAEDAEDAVVVGCDSMLAIGGEVVGKPATVEVARARWAAMAGGTGELLTGHAVVRVSGGEPVAVASATRSTTVRFASPTEAELDAYLRTGEPLAVAGAFTLDGLGGWFVEGVDGDPSSVIGISLPLTRRLLAEVGVSVVDLWRGGQE